MSPNINLCKSVDCNANEGVMYSNENRIRERYVSLSHFIMLMNVYAVLYPMHCGCCVQTVKYTNPRL